MDAILHLGDVKDAFNPVAQQVQNFMVYAAKKICKVAPFHVLLGNHDRTAVSDESDSCMPVLRAAGAFTYEKPALICIAGVWIHMVPYYRDRKVLLAHLANIGELVDQLDPDIRPQQGEAFLAFHAELNGCKMSANPNVPEGHGGIPSEGLWIDDYALCLGGHIHYQQQCGDRIWYVGSPFQQDWREANHACGFLLVTTRGNRPPLVEQIPSRIPGYLDPDLQGFDAVKATKGSQIRIRVPYVIGKDPGQQLQAARMEAEAKYPNLQIHIVSVAEGAEQLKAFDQTNAAGDEDLIKRYLSQTKAEDLEAMAACILYYLRKRGLGMMGLERLRFLKVWAENALSYEKCSVDLAGKGITLVTGENRDWCGEQEGSSNGSGKSSALSLPLIALFGKTPKGQTADAWVRQGGDGSGMVGLSLLLPDGREMVVERRRPSGLEFRIAGKLIASGDARGTQRAIEQLLRLTWDVATNALYIGQREVGTILTGTDKERKELFSRFLGLDRFLVVQEDLRAARRRCDAAAQRLQGEVDVVEGQIEQVKRTEVPVGEYSFDVCIRNLAQIQKHQTVLLCAQKRRKAELDKLEETLDNTKELFRTMDRSEGAAFTSRENAKVHLTQLESLLSTPVCPTCSSKLAPKRMEALVTSAKSTVKQANAVFQNILKEKAKLEDKQKQLITESRAISQIAFGIENELQNLRVEETTWQERYRTALEASARQKQQQAEVKRLKVASKHLKAYHTQLTDHLQFLGRCISVVGRDGLPAYLCGSVCPALNAAALKFSELFTAGTLGVQFAFSDGELDLHVENHQGGTDINDQSQGEIRMIAIIAAFALRDVLVPYNLLILDEPGEGLDAVNAKAFTDGLAQVAERFGSLFVVTHNVNILSNLEPTRRLHAVKENRVSKLEELN